MATPGTAEGHREIALPLALVARQDLGEHGFDVAEQLLRLWRLKHESRNLRGQPRVWFELRNEVRVRQISEIEDEVGVHRKAVLEPERNDSRDHSRRTAASRDVVDQGPTKLVDRQPRRVDHVTRSRLERAHALAFAANAVDDVSPRRERMSTTRLAEASDQRVVARVQEQDLDV